MCKLEGIYDILLLSLWDTLLFFLLRPWLTYRRPTFWVDWHKPTLFEIILDRSLPFIFENYVPIIQWFEDLLHYMEILGTYYAKKP